MRQMIKSFLWIVGLALGLQTAWAFSLLGPENDIGAGGNWQVTPNGFNPNQDSGNPPYFLSALLSGPKNQGEGYRRTTPTMYYTFDATFGDFFGSNGEVAVQGAFDVLNGLTNVDSYSTGLTEVPLNSVSENYQANALGLLDLKTQTLSLLMEQLGLADAIRYMWVIHDRVQVAGCQGSCPLCLEYLVTIRNFDILPTALNQIQYSAYINGELYNYFISEICTAIGTGPNVDALEIPVDPLVNNPPVASGHVEDEGGLNVGFFFTGLTRDDVAGLRWLYSTNNYDTPSQGFLEPAAAGSVLFSTNFSTPQLLFTSNYNTLVSASLTNNPAALQLLFPGLQVSTTPAFTYFSNVVSPNVIAYFTNFIGQPADQPATLVLATNLVTNIVQFYQNTFGNVVTNPFHRVYPTTTFAIQTITVGPGVGLPADSPFVTNISYSFFQSNTPSGDYFILSNGICGPNIIQTLQTNVSIVTNGVVGITNANGQAFVENLISYFTNYAFVVQPCTLVSNAIGNFRGVEKLRFVRVPDDNYDYQTRQFYQPITNTYNTLIFTNGQYVNQTFQRVLSAPDFVFGASDLAVGPGAGNAVAAFTRTVNFNQTTVQPGLAGPGTIDDSVNSIVFDKVGPIYYNTSLSFLSGPDAALTRAFLWGSFDGTTNAPVVYPNGTSVANLAAEALIQISPPPPDLPAGTNGVVYNNAMTVTAGGQGPYNWSLTSASAGLPPGLSLSPNGVISGTPTQSGTFDNIVIQMTDSSVPIARTVNLVCSITIN